MKRYVAILPLAVLLGLVLLGCDQPPQAGTPTVNVPPAPPPPPPPPGAEQPTEAPAAPPGPPPLPVEAKVGVFGVGLDDLARPVTQAEPSAPPASPTAEANTEVVKAGKGVGAKGRSLDPHEGLYVTPVK